MNDDTPTLWSDLDQVETALRVARDLIELGFDHISARLDRDHSAAGLTAPNPAIARIDEALQINGCAMETVRAIKMAETPKAA